MKNNKELLELLQALADPIRLDIMACIMSGHYKKVNPDQYGIAKATLSHHVKILKEAQLLSVEKKGVCHEYSVNEVFLKESYPELLALLENNLSLSVNA